MSARHLLYARKAKLSPPLALAAWTAENAVTVYDFHQTPGTDLSAIGWTKTGGASTAVISATNTVDLSYSAAEALYAIDAGNVAHYAEAYLNPVNGTASSFPLCVRVIDVNNFIGIRTTRLNFEVFQRVAGTFTSLLLVGVSSPVYSTGPYRLEARADGTCAVFFAGNLMGTVTIPAALAAATKVGMVVRSGNGGLANALDDFHIQAGAALHGKANGSWCWFASPRSVSASGKTWWGITRITSVNAGYGSAVIAEYDHASGVTTQYVLRANAVGMQDDHCDPTILIRPDGRLVAFYTLHPSPTGIWFRVSVNPHDASAWGAEAVFAAPDADAANYVTYPSPVMLSDESNRVYVFYRGIAQGLCCVTSDDLAAATAPASDGASMGTVTWSAAAAWVQQLISTEKGVYAKVWSDGVSRIDFALTNAKAGDVGAKVDVRHMYYTGGTAYASDGTALPAFPWVINTEATAIATSAAPDSYGDVWVWDCYRNATTGYVYVVFVRFISQYDHRYYYAVWNGVTWTKREIPNTSSGAIPNPSGGSVEFYYSPGICLDPSADGVIYCGIGPAYHGIAMYRMVTLDRGKTWSRQVISPPARGGGARYTGANFRPVVPLGRVSAKCAVIWLNGDYDDTSNANPAIGGGYHSDVFMAALPS